MPLKIRKPSGNTAILMVCMGIAFFLWTLTKLSNSYLGEVEVDISFVNMPDDRIPTAALPEKITVTAEATGFKLLLNSLRWNNKAFEVDYQRYARDNKIMVSDFRPELVNTEFAEYKVISISPGTFNFNFDKVATKRVPVSLKQELSFHKQYNLVEEPVLTPDSVTITGPAAVIDTLNRWNTELLKLNNLKENVTRTVKLQQDPRGVVHVRPETLQCTVPVEEYTERSISVDIKLLNEPDSIDVVIFPRKVDVTFKVGLSNYNSVEDAVFEAVVDYNNIEPGNTHTEIELIDHPYYIRDISLSPRQVEFFIYNK